MSNKFKEWHISLIEKVQKTTGISNYQIVWLSFIEGLIIGLIIGYLLWCLEEYEELFIKKLEYIFIKFTIF